MKSVRLKYVSLVLVNLVYACTSIFTKLASNQDILSIQYVLYIGGAAFVMLLYALLWQQVITRMPLSTAYMFKGTSLIFVLLISAFLFGESITINNMVGSAIIVFGIVLYSQV